MAEVLRGFYPATKLVRPSQAGRISTERAAVYYRVRQALKYGVLRIEPCCRCGATRKVHAHHADYDAPLDVEFLCPSCHALLHRS